MTIFAAPLSDESLLALGGREQRGVLAFHGALWRHGVRYR